MLFFLVAALLIFLGYLIKYKKVTWLISGYNTASKQAKQKYDVEKLCKHMGNFLFTLASVYLVMAISLVLIDKYSELIIRIGFWVQTVVIVCGIVYLNTGNRVKKDDFNK